MTLREILRNIEFAVCQIGSAFLGHGKRHREHSFRVYRIFDDIANSVVEFPQASLSNGDWIVLFPARGLSYRDDAEYVLQLAESGWMVEAELFLAKLNTLNDSVPWKLIKVEKNENCRVLHEHAKHGVPSGRRGSEGSGT